MITNQIISMFNPPMKEVNELIVKQLLTGTVFQILNSARFTQVNSDNFLCCTGDCKKGCRKICPATDHFVVEDVELHEHPIDVQFSVYILKLKIGEEISYMTHRTFLFRLKAGDIKESDTPDRKSCP